MTRKTKRSDEAYEITALTKGLVVLEALEGTAFEPVSVDRIMRRTALTRDTADRVLKTLRLRGYAEQNERRDWHIGKRFLRFAAKAAQTEDL